LASVAAFFLFSPVVVACASQSSSDRPPSYSKPTTAVAKTPAPIATRTPTPSPSPAPDKRFKKFKVGPKPAPPKLLPTKGTPIRVGATCVDGSGSDATGRGACSWHGGVAEWLYEQPAWVYENKAENAQRTKSYKAKLKKWKATTARNTLLAKYPYSKGPYTKKSPGYASWRDTNHNGIACDG
jgi:hypothetical protein